MCPAFNTRRRRSRAVSVKDAAGHYRRFVMLLQDSILSRCYIQIEHDPTRTKPGLGTTCTNGKRKPIKFEYVGADNFDHATCLRFWFGSNPSDAVNVDILRENGEVVGLNMNLQSGNVRHFVAQTFEFGWDLRRMDSRNPSTVLPSLDRFLV